MILVSGGTGLLGKHLLEILIEEGESIRAIRRSKKYNLSAELEQKIEWVEGDILDICFLEEAMKGIKKVYHCAAIVSFHHKDYERMIQTNVVGTTNIINLSIDNQIEKFVYVSSIAALGRAEPGKIITEETEWKNSKNNSEYAVSKYLAEKEVWRGIGEGLNAIIVNPSVILGSGDWTQNTCRLFPLIQKGLRFYSTGSNGFVGAKDVASIMVKLMQSDIHNERFILSSENLSYKELFHFIAKYLNIKPPSIKVSPILSEIAWRIESVYSKIRSRKPYITKESSRIASKHYTYNSTKAKKALNIEFTPIHKVIKDICTVYIQQAN